MVRRVTSAIRGYFFALISISAFAQGSSTPSLGCVPFERLTCGCQIRLIQMACQAPSSAAQPHLFTDLKPDSLLLMVIDGKEVSLPLFSHQGGPKGERPVRWADFYRGNKIDVRLTYSPGANTCPASKRSDDGCEFVDVNVKVELTAPGSSKSLFTGLGTCGC